MPTEICPACRLDIDSMSIEQRDIHNWNGDLIVGSCALRDSRGRPHREPQVRELIEQLRLAVLTKTDVTVTLTPELAAMVLSEMDEP
jgi:hypothetical protein